MKKILAFILSVLTLTAIAPTASARHEPFRRIDGTFAASAKAPDTSPTPELSAEPEPEMTYLGEFRVTGYDPYCTHCCARADGITASGATVTEGYTVAMCKDYPFGTKIYIDGLGIFEVQDRGVGEGKIDIALGSHDECYAVTGRYDVWIITENG